MSEVKKITLYPVSYLKRFSKDAIGTAFFSEDGNNISLNIFNLPHPEIFSDETHRFNCYKAWLYNNQKENVLPLGTLESSGDGLYILYDIPLKNKTDFDEILITCEEKENKEPSGEIMLIGYLDRIKTTPLEEFQPFSKPLPLHKWWKIEEKETYFSLQMRCHQCPYSTYYPAFYNEREENFDLPLIIGLKTDESGKITHLVHGIPGRLLKSSQPDMGLTGYLYWHPYYGIKEKRGAIGYWLCYIDPHTNQIATPMGVTIPPL